MELSEIIGALITLVFIILPIIFIATYVKRSAKILNKSFGSLLLLVMFLNLFGVLIIFIMRKTKEAKENLFMKNTAEVVDMIKSGKLPNSLLIKASNFNQSHVLWNDYLVLFEKEEERKAALAEKERLRREEEERKFQEKIIKLKEKWGEAKINMVLRGELFVDMDLELLKMAKGSPDLVDERVINREHKFKYFYGKYNNQRGNDAYRFQVDVEKGKVIGWKNLDIN